MDAGMRPRFDVGIVKRRAPVWAALSDLFVDTDVSIFYADIVEVLKRSRYTPEEIEHIFFDEVGPVFYTNLIADSPVWSAWPPEVVREHILDFISMDVIDQRVAQGACHELVEDLFDAHWPTIYDAAWGRYKRQQRPPQRGVPLDLPPRPPLLRMPKLDARRLLRWSPAIVGALLLLIVAYEALAVVRAQARTANVLERAWSEAGPPLSRELQVSWIEALLRVEDPSFRTHRGVDFDTPGQGMTTITQALVKRLYFDNFAPGFAKIEQSLIARFVLNSAITKDEQLDLFLSLAYFGNENGEPVIGFRDAAMTYYGRALGELDRRQFLTLVAMLPAPNNLKPGTPENTERLGRIERMLNDECAPANWRDVWLEACAQ